MSKITDDSSPLSYAAAHERQRLAAGQEPCHCDICTWVRAQDIDRSASVCRDCGKRMPLTKVGRFPEHVHPRRRGRACHGSGHWPQVGAAGLIRHYAPLTCPSCEHEFRGLWIGEETGTNRCPACGHVFDATWPGFQLEPEVVIVRADGTKIPAEG